jgi:hypothetical protein
LRCRGSILRPARRQRAQRYREQDAGDYRTQMDSEHGAFDVTGGAEI